MKILLADSFDKSLPERLRRFGDVSTDMKTLGETDVILIRSKTKVTRELLADAPKVKLVIRGGVGLDNVDQPACKERNIKVMNTPEASSVAVAELAMALMLAVPNRLVEAHNSMKEGKWLKKELKRTELYQKTLGLVGIGRIGTEVAKRCAAFGMKVIAFDPGITSHAVAELKSLDEVLAETIRRTSTPEDDEEAVGEVDTLVDAAEAILPKQDDEFRCTSCRLLKKTSQLADRTMGLCRDCV